jgi:hypothetical protein
VVPTFCSIKRSYELPPLIKPWEWDGDKLRWPNIQNMDYDTTSNNFEHQPIKRSFPTQHNTPNTTLPPTQKYAAAYFTLTSHTPPALIHICHRYIFNDGWIKQPIKFWVLLISVPKTLVKVLKEVILYWKNTLYTFKTLTQISMYFLLYLCSLNSISRTLVSIFLKFYIKEVLHLTTYLFKNEKKCVLHYPQSY